MKKTLGILLAAAMLAAALAGCGGGAASASVPAGNPGPAPASTPAADPVQLSFFGFKTGGEIGALEELIAKFNAENPDIVVSYDYPVSETVIVGEIPDMYLDKGKG